MGPWECCLREIHEHTQEPVREDTRLVILPTSNVKAAGRGDRATFKNSIGVSGIYQDLEDGNEGEVEVNPTIQNSGIRTVPSNRI